jgi:hypothetical protein
LDCVKVQSFRLQRYEPLSSSHTRKIILSLTEWTEVQLLNAPPKEATRAGGWKRKTKTAKDGKKEKKPKAFYFVYLLISFLGG